MPEHKRGKNHKIGRNRMKCARYALKHGGEGQRKHYRKLRRPLSVTGAFAGVPLPRELAVTASWTIPGRGQPKPQPARRLHPWPTAGLHEVKRHGWIGSNAEV